MKIILQRKYAIIILVSYFLLLSYWMLLGFGRNRASDYMYNLKPFSTIVQLSQVKNYNLKVWSINIIGNIGVFVPFGILIPLTFQTKLLKSLIIFEAGLVILELAQLVTKRGSFDIDDFILNTFGLILGYGIYRFIVSMYDRKAKQ